MAQPITAAPYHASRTDGRQVDYSSSEVREQAAADLARLLATRSQGQDGHPRRDRAGRALPPRVEMGKNGEHVRVLQHAINAYFGRRVVDVDGDFRGFSRGALGAVQRELDRSRSPDYVGGRDTYERLHRALTAAPRTGEIPRGVRVEPERTRSPAAARRIAERAALAPPTTLGGPRQRPTAVDPAPGQRADTVVGATRDAARALEQVDPVLASRAAAAPLRRVAALGTDDRDRAVRELVASVPAERRVASAAALVRGDAETAEVRAQVLRGLELTPSQTSVATHGLQANELDPRVRAVLGPSASDVTLAALRHGSPAERGPALQRALGDLAGLPPEVRAAEVARVADGILSGAPDARIAETTALLGGEDQTELRREIVSDLRRERPPGGSRALDDGEAWQATYAFKAQGGRTAALAALSGDPVLGALGTTRKPDSAYADEANRGVSTVVEALRASQDAHLGADDARTRERVAAEATTGVGDHLRQLERLRTERPDIYVQAMRRLGVELGDPPPGSERAGRPPLIGDLLASGRLTPEQSERLLGATDEHLSPESRGHIARRIAGLLEQEPVSPFARRFPGLAQRIGENTEDPIRPHVPTTLAATVATERAKLHSARIARLNEATVGDMFIPGMMQLGTWGASALSRLAPRLFSSTASPAAQQSGLRLAMRAAETAERTAAPSAATVAALRHAVRETDAMIPTLQRALLEARSLRLEAQGQVIAARLREARELLAAGRTRLDGLASRLEAARPVAPMSRSAADPVPSWQLSELLRRAGAPVGRPMSPIPAGGREPPVLGVWTRPMGLRGQEPPADLPRVLRKLWEQ